MDLTRWLGLGGLLLGAAVPAFAQSLPMVRPTPGLVITRSVRIAPGTYRWRASANPDSALLIIRGSGITVDLRGVTLIGTPPASAPDAAQGTALFIDGGERITVRGLTARGYRFGIHARGVRTLHLDDNTLSYSWKPRLFSVVEHESLNDWLSYHKNESGEWKRFGAGLYLDHVVGGALRRNTVRQSMNGLLLTHSDSLSIRDNDFSFNSGLGIGMYRSSWHVIVHNRADFNVRGSSTGFYQRGQDSAALLMFEQCQHNVVAYNSMTHSGDGLFLWAGQQTMDSGQGGSNDNLFLMNDFSFAPTNGMEATFSRNQFIGNRVAGSTHGLWGGYSFSSRVVGNCFAHNRIAIAIEHGQDNLIGGNRFLGDTLGIRLWADSIEPSDWGYPKHRDTRSRDWRVVENRFARVPERWRIANTSALDTSRNVVADTSEACDPARNVPTTAWWRVARIDSEPRRWPEVPLAEKPRDAIVVDEWGPYDWRDPKLWPLDSTRASTLRLRTLGPPGRWRVTAQRGVARLSQRHGRVGDTLAVTPHPDSAGDWRVELMTASGVRFSYERFEPRQVWTQRIFAYGDSADPFTHADAFAALLTRPPVAVRTAPRLDWFWSRPRDREIPAAKMAMEATATVTLAPGRYTLRTLSDDAVRVWVDDQLVIDHFTPHETAPAYATLAGGRHTVRVLYVQVGGWVELRLDWLRGVVQPSMGSAGPH
ncbi:MAG: right-handed parallel beta-helix repeat-containing protein [Gemmatimonadaceae bacterium]|nr:right-handed parallel beta-helix repeat-containing protein [Gemmatimonadaceae bacterium]